ncbi:Nose resistant to fluoxetine protein isoform 5 [Schistosoma japonicum]|uniref:Nose resistant to fluoxetine protein isoform 5 n=2 Tax=Schistosoma japonicum TaxID=6182 RepID=A0A4Z2DJG2_SCHJA|nr:Nose resistant to fluoxetine protein isoform 5 [Schistosoma japonicum]
MLRNIQHLYFLWFLITSSLSLYGCHGEYSVKSTTRNRYFSELTDANYVKSYNVMHNLFGSNNVYTRLKLPLNKTLCTMDINSIILGIYQRRRWALQWLDATAHPPPGIIGGAMHWVGSYDVCLQSLGYHSNNEVPKFRGIYCTMVFDMNNSIAIIPELHMSIGLCMPNTCTNEEVRNIVNTTAYYLLLRLNQNESFCHRYVSEIQKDAWYYISVSICSILTILVVIATSIDLFLYIKWYQMQQLNKYVMGSNHINERNSMESVNHVDQPTLPLLESDDIEYNDNGQEIPRKSDCKHFKTFSEYRKTVLDKYILIKVIGAYSLPANTKQLCTERKVDGTSNTTNDVSLKFIDGIRFISMIWIIGGHILLHGYKVTNNLLILASEFRRIWLLGMYFNGHLAPDIYFLLSGLLMCYVCMQRLSNIVGIKNRIKFWLMVCLHRFIRLTPAYLMTVIFLTGLLVHIYDGPFFPQDINTPIIASCRKNWYILYLNNLFNFKFSCLQWCWYIANDIQYTIFLAPIFVTLLMWKRIAGVVFAFSLILMSSLITYYIAYNNSFEIMDVSKEEIYVRPYTRCGTYMIGMLTGWLYYDYPRIEMRNISKHKILLGSIGYVITAFLIISPIFISYGVLSGLITEISVRAAASYLAFHRVIFTLGIAISIYQCAIGWSKPIYKMFTLSAFHVPARLTYCAYLIHPIIVIILINGTQTPFMIDQLEIVRLTASVTVFSYAIAYILSMTTEYPICTLEKYLFN